MAERHEHLTHSHRSALEAYNAALDVWLASPGPVTKALKNVCLRELMKVRTRAHKQVGKPIGFRERGRNGTAHHTQNVRRTR